MQQIQEVIPKPTVAVRRVAGENVEDRLLRGAQAQKQNNKQKEEEKKTREAQLNAQIRKISDKYILAKFNREFEQTANDLCS